LAQYNNCHSLVTIDVPLVVHLNGTIVVPFDVPFAVHLNGTIVVPFVVPFVTIVVSLQGLHLWRTSIEK
jgi:hypothetical protein